MTVLPMVVHSAAGSVGWKDASMAARWAARWAVC